MSGELATLDALASRVEGASEALRASSLEQRAAFLGRAFATLADQHSELGREARAMLPAATGLSDAMVRWALEHGVAPLTSTALHALACSARLPHERAALAVPGRLCAVLLAGNVAIGAARAIAMPLLFGWPVLAKAPAQGDPFARLLERALELSDPVLAGAFGLHAFSSDAAPLLDLLLERAELVSAYGSDETLAALRQRLSPRVPLLEHGHGLGAALIAREALANDQAACEAARGLALDVAAYDQRGCLSPQVAWVEQGGGLAPERFAELLDAELARLDRSLPRGALPLAAAAQQLSWRGVSALRGRLFEGAGYGIAYETETALRIGPGHRNLQLVAISDRAELRQRLAPLGEHLKCLGVAPSGAKATLLPLLPPRVAPRLCPVGTMQLPPVDALHEGVPAWQGLVRWVDLSR